MSAQETRRVIAGEVFVLAEPNPGWEEAHAAKHEYHHAGYKSRIIDGDVWVGGPRAHMPRCCIANPPSNHTFPPLITDRAPRRVRFTHGHVDPSVIAARKGAL